MQRERPAMGAPLKRLDANAACARVPCLCRERVLKATRINGNALPAELAAQGVEVASCSPARWR